MTSKVGKRPLRSLSAHEKMEAIRRVHDGESKASVARDIGVPESTLRGWCKNEDKILYLSRQSTPDTDDSDHLQSSRDKKQRYDSADISSLQPYNLSVRGASNSPPPATIADAAGADAPTPVTVAADTTAINEALPAALNLTNKLESSKAPIIPTTTSTAASLSAADKERERNRAELTRLSIELGLNRPEMFLPNNSSIAANLSDLSASLTANLGIVAQWNNALMQQVNAASLTTNSAPKKRSASTAALDAVTSQIPVQPVVTTTTPTTTSSASVTGTHYSQHHNNNSINNNKSSKVKKQHLDNTVDDSVWYWLKTQQAMLGLVQNSSTQNNVVDPNSSWFWKWYKQLAYGQMLPQVQQQQQQQLQLTAHQQSTANNTVATPEKPILYQQLTKEVNSENQETPKSTKPSNQSTKVRAVLDNLLLNNNNNNEDTSAVVLNNGVDKKVTSLNFDNLKPVDESGITPASTAEALCHGEMFLRWLEKCGDPSVTAVQILQFRYLLNNIRTGADRKNGSEYKSNKVRSRK